MTITEINIFPRYADSLLAIAHIVIDDVFIIKGIKIVDGKNGTFISMPSSKNRKGEHRDICHPLNTETRNEIERLIIEKYKQTKLDNPKEEIEDPQN